MGNYYSHEKEPTQCIVIHPHLVVKAHGDENSDRVVDVFQNNNLLRTPETCLEEAINLTAAIDLKVIHSEIVTVKTVTPSTLIGSGAVERIKGIIDENNITLAVIDFPLSPGQQRSLEKHWKCKVIDRTGLILEIFANRARTAEGKLQVELALLDYQKSRLVRAWTHLERQRATGKTGGPGEKQIELDKRLIADRVVKLRKELAQVEKRRHLQKSKRDSVPYPIVALVGYTNAGKSTLFNRLTGADVLAKDMLFATLDPTMREVKLPSGKRIILSDTVGFISNLPHQLIASFKATLEEVIEADIILHVQDISSSAAEAEKNDVLSILKELNIDINKNNYIIDINNKIDKIKDIDTLSVIRNNEKRMKDTLYTSAITGEGIDKLLNLLDEKLCHSDKHISIVLPVINGKAISWLYDNGDILSKRSSEDGNHDYITLRMSQLKIGQFNTLFNNIKVKYLDEK